MLTYNLFHNAGAIYDTTIDTVDLLRYGDPNYRAYWQTAGFNAGYILKQVTYRPKDYDPYKGKKPTPTPLGPNNKEPNKPPKSF